MPGEQKVSRKLRDILSIDIKRYSLLMNDNEAMLERLLLSIDMEAESYETK